MGECDDDPTQEQDDLLEDGHGFRYGGGTPGDVFIRTATDIRKVLPSIFNLKVVSDVTTCDSHAEKVAPKFVRAKRSVCWRAGTAHSVKLVLVFWYQEIVWNFYQNVNVGLKDM